MLLEEAFTRSTISFGNQTLCRRLKLTVNIRLRQSLGVRREEKYPVRLLLLREGKIEFYLICAQLTSPD